METFTYIFRVIELISGTTVAHLTVQDMSPEGAEYFANCLIDRARYALCLMH